MIRTDAVDRWLRGEVKGGIFGADTTGWGVSAAPTPSLRRALRGTGGTGLFSQLTRGDARKSRRRGTGASRHAPWIPAHSDARRRRIYPLFLRFSTVSADTGNTSGWHVPRRFGIPRLGLRKQTPLTERIYLNTPKRYPRSVRLTNNHACSVAIFALIPEKHIIRKINILLTEAPCRYSSARHDFGTPRISD